MPHFFNLWVKFMQKHNSNTTSNLVKLYGSTAPKAPPYIKLHSDVEIRFNEIVRAREFSAWTTVDLEHAATLANALADLDRLRHEVISEGEILINHRGDQVLNPRLKLIETLSRRSIALSRLLHVHPQATAGQSQKQGQRNQQHRDAMAALNAIDDDGLLARPQ